MKKKVWEVHPITLPPAVKYCKKCGKKMEFTCSEQFRINAQRRYLDIWLIYKCSNCDTTWNATVYSRISPQALNTELLDRFYKNDQALAKQYAMNSAFLHGNGAEAGMPRYSVIGECFSLDEAIEVEIKSKYAVPIKVSSLVRNKLNLSRKEYTQLVMEGKIKSIPEQNLQKCKLKDGLILVFG